MQYLWHNRINIFQIQNVILMILSHCVKIKKNVHLYGDPGLNGNKNKFILKATLTYMKYKN